MRRLPACSAALAVGILVTACAAGSSPTAPSSPAPSGSALPSAQRASASASVVPATASLAVSPTPSTAAASGAVTACGQAGYTHQAAALEAVLPKKVAGRDLTVWSMVGDCWLKTLASDSTVFADLVQLAKDNGVELNDLQYGIAGRSDLAHPPFFVYGVVRPADRNAADLAEALMIAGGGFKDGSAVIESPDWTMTNLGDHAVLGGTSAMLKQDEHQRGTPYIVKTEHFTFLVITDDEAWAREAIGQLPT
jgi:hypothetical protein